MKKLVLITWMMLLWPMSVHATLQNRTVEYKQGEAILEGYLVYDDAVEGKRPGVIVVHDWMGLSDYAKSRADMLARSGYVVMAVDIYGKGVRPQNPDEASAQASKYKSDRGLLRDRAMAGLEVLKAHPLADAQRIAAIGYCFGGTTILEMARAGMDLSGVVSFHGGLQTPVPAGAGSVKAKILVLHGADDPYVPSEEVAAFQKEMNAAGADWQMVYYHGAVHSFTRPDAGSDNSKGAAYNKNADKRSWEHMKVFFTEIFNESPRNY